MRDSHDSRDSRRDRSVEEVLRELAALGHDLERALRDSENLQLSIEDIRAALARLRQTLGSAVPSSVSADRDDEARPPGEEPTAAPRRE